MDCKLPTRKALDSVSLNRSKLPTPGSKLKPPVTVKRSRSPEEAPANKRQRTSQDNPVNKPKPPATGNKLRPAKSTGSLNKVGLTNSTGPSGGRKLTGQTSGGNLRNAAVKNTANRGPAAAKPPPKPERTSRKNWSKATETCLFISCDSTGHSEVEEDSICVSQDGCMTDVGDNHFSRVHNVSLFSDDESVTGIRLDHTDCGGDVRVDLDHDATPISVTDHDAAPISLTVVSCSRGVVNATCNCTVCLTTGADRAEFDDRAKHTGNDRVGNNGRQEGHEQLLQEFAKEANARSLLPKPAARLTAGKVAMTPAPVKRSRSKSGKPGTGKTDVKHGGEQKMVKNDATRISKLPLKEKPRDKIKMDVMPHKEFSKIGVRSTKSNATCNKELKSDNVAIRKSCHEFEDSEPECAQHEKICRENDQCGETVLKERGVWTTASENRDKESKIVEHKSNNKHEQENVYSSRELNCDKVIDCDVKSAGIVQKGSELQNLCTIKSKLSPTEHSSVATFIHNPKPDTSQGEGSDNRHVECKRDRCSSSERPSSRSQIPVRACRSPVKGQTSTSPNQSLTSISRESSQSPARTSLQSIGSPASKLPPRSPVYSRNSPSVTKRPPLSSRPNSPASPYCVSVKSPSQKTSNDSRTSSLNKLTNLAPNQLKSLKSSNLVPQNGLTDRKVHTAGIPKLVLNKQACPRVINAEKRNLPRAPEKRTLRYGQRCMSDEELYDKGNAANKVTNGTAAPKPAPGGGGGKKRPAWDIKGRLQDMEEMMKTKDQQMMKLSEIMGNLTSNNKQLSGTAAEKEQQYTSVSKEKDILQSKLVESETELHTIKLKLERETEHFELTRNSLRRQKEELESQLNALQITESQLRSSLAQVTSSQEIIKAELAATKVSLEQSLNEGKVKDAELAELRAIKIEFEEKFRNFETERRKLHNTIQELKGNIRVFCRVRPLLGDELLGNDGEIQHMNFPDDDNKTVELEKLGDVSLSETMINSTKRGSNGRYSFSFDKVFLPDSTQMTVFEEISQLVQSALDGYNVCIFAYGQTGSGKTYTMEGPSVEDEETMGMISRATIQIFQNTRDLEDKGWQYEFEASFLEIYNETIRDLLGNHGPDVKHDIKLGPGGKDVVVTNLTTQQVTRREQIVSILRTASKNRAVGETQCNERSSRSHSVFRLKITGANEITGETCAGTLNLIDLAGSERLKESGATGQRLKETQNINKSLANLGNVIMALGNKEPHVPYRNSKLTYLLQNSLGGNSKTLMFVNVSPREEHFSETVNSLRFATKVNQCNIGTATKKSK